jgi:hypothetical protein
MRQGSTRQLLIGIVAAATITLSAGQAQADKSASGIIDSIGPSIDSKFDNLNQSQKTGIAAGVGTTAAVGVGAATALGILRLRQSRIRGRLNAENNLSTEPAPKDSNLKPTGELDESGNLRNAAPLNTQIEPGQLEYGAIKQQVVKGDNAQIAQAADANSPLSKDNAIRNSAFNEGSVQDVINDPNFTGSVTDREMAIAARNNKRLRGAKLTSDPNEILGEQTSGWNAAARSKRVVGFGTVKEGDGNVVQNLGNSQSPGEIREQEKLQAAIDEANEAASESSAQPVTTETNIDEALANNRNIAVAERTTETGDFGDATEAARTAEQATGGLGGGLTGGEEASVTIAEHVDE